MYSISICVFYLNTCIYLNTYILSQYVYSISICVFYLNMCILYQYIYSISIHVFYLNMCILSQYVYFISIHLFYLNTCIINMLDLQKLLLTVMAYSSCNLFVSMSIRITICKVTKLIQISDRHIPKVLSRQYRRPVWTKV